MEWPHCTGFLALLGRTLSHTHPLCTPRTRPFADQRFLGCIRRSNSTLHEFVCGHGTCLLTNRGRKQHRHRPKWTKISNMSSVQHANLGVPNSPFQWLSEYTPHTPPFGTLSRHKWGTTAPTPENAPSWHEITRPREICDPAYWAKANPKFGLPFLFSLWLLKCYSAIGGIMVRFIPPILCRQRQKGRMLSTRSACHPMRTPHWVRSADLNGTHPSKQLRTLSSCFRNMLPNSLLAH